MNKMRLMEDFSKETIKLTVNLEDSHKSDLFEEKS